MDRVSYLMLAEQYAAFLVAVGSVSITVLALVLNLGSRSNKKISNKKISKELEKDSRTFLIAALIVATVSCFIGAHMMAETSAFIQYSKEIGPAASGTRLFLLASTNIFVAALLVLFALMLLPAASGAKNAARITPISITVFISVTAAIIYWLVRAAVYRMHVQCAYVYIGVPFVIGFLWFLFLYKIPKPLLLFGSFALIVISTVLLLGYFATTFADDGPVRTRDIFGFSLIIFICAASLLAAGIRIMWGDLTRAIKALWAKVVFGKTIMSRWIKSL